jgi:D-3-phosphoglycerate dehydrogenase
MWPMAEDDDPATPTPPHVELVDLPIVVALGSVDPSMVGGPLRGHARFVASPGPTELSLAAGAIVRAQFPVDTAMLDRMPRLRVIARTGVGVDMIDVRAATQRHIAVVVTPDTATEAVAEGTIGMALHLTKQFGRLTDLVRDGRWDDRDHVHIGDLEGSTIGVVGFGRIGRRVAELAECFRMTILAHDPLSPPPEEVRCDDIQALAAAADILTLHAPLTAGTRHLVDRRLLAAAKPGMLLINCGRGGLVDLDAVLVALRSGVLAGVGLDVFEPEPPPPHPLFLQPNVVLTPHLLGLSRRAMASTFMAAAQGVADVLTGRRPSALAEPSWRPGRDR